ncbi:MAG: glycoside hydrolase family 9 protein [Bacillota bacterium]
MKKFVCFVLSLAMLLTLFIPQGMVSAAGTYNYAEALQKAIYFYEAQQAGPLPSWNRVEWRGDATMKDAVTGGWYDAGDHVKFNLPMSYTASMLGWALYEYGDEIAASGQKVHLENNLKFVLDYLVACDKGGSIVYQVGDGGKDHSWWGPVEVIENEMTRPTFSTSSASCVAGQMAAALAIGSIVLNNSTYLQHAKSLFTLADSAKSDSGYTAASGFYNSWSGYYDELLWASTWLYIATNDSTYLTKAESYVPKLNRQGQTTLIEYKWGHCWDDSHYGALLLLARLTGKQEYHDFVQMHLNWWTPEGHNGEKVRYTPGGLAWLDSWGSLRYATTAAFLASVYADSITDETLKTRYNNFAKAQIDYALGSNPNNRSYVVGFGVNPPQRPHHRTAHGSWCDMQTVPDKHRHVLYGALVGGPNLSDAYKDDISDYVSNEVATDYNAGFVGILTKMVSLYGGTPQANFPPKEVKDDEFFVEASINSSGPNYTEIKALLNNRSGWPARLVKNLSYNYYVDLTEVFAAGKTEADITVTKGYSEFPVTISPLTKVQGNIYSVKITYTDGYNIWPGGQSEYAGELQFRIAAPVGTTFWDAKNDYSFQGLTNAVTKTKYIPVYDGTTLLYGVEPFASPSPTPSEPPLPTPVLKYGDLNASGTVDSTDLALMKRHLLKISLLSSEVLKAADVNGDGNVDSTDYTLMKRKVLKIIDVFPVEQR